MPSSAPINQFRTDSQTDVTGSSSATKAIVDIYDIFGFAPQIIQGADALAAALGAVVFIPDLLEGNYAKGEVCLLSLPSLYSLISFVEGNTADSHSGSYPPSPQNNKQPKMRLSK